MTEVLEHLKNPQYTLSEIRRILRPKGYLILSTPNIKFDKLMRLREKIYRRFIYKRIYQPIDKAYSHSEVVSMLKNNGFEIVMTKKSGPTPFFQKFLYKFPNALNLTKRIWIMGKKLNK